MVLGGFFGGFGWFRVLVPNRLLTTKYGNYTCPVGSGASIQASVISYQKSFYLDYRIKINLNLLQRFLLFVVCTVQLRLVHARKLQRIQRKKYCALQARIFSYWEDYAGSKISSRHALT